MEQSVTKLNCEKEPALLYFGTCIDVAASTVRVDTMIINIECEWLPSGGFHMNRFLISHVFSVSERPS
ncbi:hypothetical protein J6590_062137 [Homalodisca vitripennis]|nr:hypothetical protein J6590_062137 [Homalodisca vitripennis]